MSLTPVLHRLLVKPDNVEDADESIRRAKAMGIVVQLDKREQAAVESGEVIAIGDTAFKAFEATVMPKVGDMIYFAKYAGKKLKDGDTEYLCLNDEDVVCIINNKE